MTFRFITTSDVPKRTVTRGLSDTQKQVNQAIADHADDIQALTEPNEAGEIDVNVRFTMKDERAAHTKARRLINNALSHNGFDNIKAKVVSNPVEKDDGWVVDGITAYLWLKSTDED